MNKINYWLLFLFAFGLRWAEAHTLPQSKAQLVVNRQNVLIHFKTPVEIMELAQKRSVRLSSPPSMDSLKSYVLRHITITDSLKSNWKIEIKAIQIQEATDREIGKFPELTIDISLTPSHVESLKDFTMNCDWIVHQIPTQSIIFSVEQDWKNGIIQHNPKQIGVIALDIPTWKVFPLRIKLEEGNVWKGFKSMFFLGISHISEGTDHLLFIITLLLPACLLVENKKWTKFGGTKYSLVRLLKIITAFTVGHSVTLAIGALDFIQLPVQWIEITIAFSILISAIHAIKPLFYGKEIFIAVGFGLIHGLAFSQTLTNLQLIPSQLIISILGFNLGIEVMQILVIALIIPWFIVLSQTIFFKYIRIPFAFLVVAAALGWIFQRITNQTNFITQITDQLLAFFPWLVLVLAMVSVGIFVLTKKRKI